MTGIQTLDNLYSMKEVDSQKRQGNFIKSNECEKIIGEF